MLDALHLWNVVAKRNGAIDLKLDRPSDAAREAIGTLLAALDGDVPIRITPTPQAVPDFPSLAGKWADRLEKRDQEMRSLPVLAERLKAAVGDCSFRWHKTLHSRITGRVDGLVVCTLLSPSTGILRIGKSEKAQELFEKIAGAPKLDMTDQTIERDAKIIRDLVESRRNGELSKIAREHLLEARVLRGAIDVTSPSGRALTPAITSGQLPARWATGGRARYLDALMQDAQDLWAVELKIRSGGAGKYLRHGVGQVVLYRDFIRGATPLHEYLARSGAEPSTCRAAVAFPRLTGSEAESRTHDVRVLGKLFDVDVLELDAKGH